MAAKKPVSTFTKINGFKRLITCRRCRNKFFSEKVQIFCKACSKKIK